MDGETIPVAARISVPRTPAERAAVEELFLAHEQRLGRYLAQMVREPALAEDLLQDTFVEALKSHEALQAADASAAWLFGIARNRALGALRKRRRYHAALARLRPRQYDSTDGEVVAALDLLERALAPEDRSLVLLRYLHGFDALELADMTASTPAAIRQRLSRARRRLLEAAGHNNRRRR